MSAHAALKQIVWECLTHLQGNQEMVLHGEGEEGVHQMRVALRRLRSALNVFRCVASKQSCADIVKELRWITGVLGHARDLDVFATQTLQPMLLQLKTHPRLIRLNKKISQARLQAYVEVRAALTSQRYQRLLLNLSAWLENERWREANAIEYSVLDIAQTMLAKRHKQLKKHGELLTHMRPEERHATRIAAKKLRYSAEFFAGLYPKTKSHDFLPSLAKLLGILGALNDIAVTENLVRRLIDKNTNHALDESLHLFTGWNACNALHQTQNMERIWNRFTRQKPFWD